MSTGRGSHSGGFRRLSPCRQECECPCHSTSGTQVDLHPDGYCFGKELTNTPEKLSAYRSHRRPS